VSTTTSTIPLSRGAPSLDIIDVDGLREAAERAFANDPAGATAYGTAVGYPPLRRLIAEWHGVEEDQVLITNGSMQADAFLFDELASAGNEVIVERPSYDRTLLALRQRGAEIVPVALEPDGIDVAAVERLLSRPAWRAELGNNARKFAEGKFSLDNVRAQYEACYRELLQRKGVRTSPETWRPKTEARRNG